MALGRAWTLLGSNLNSKPQTDAKGFQVLPRRWVVERTFAWFGRYRRLARDYEHQTLSSESMVYLASIHRMLRLLTCET